MVKGEVAQCFGTSQSWVQIRHLHSRQQSQSVPGHFAKDIKLCIRRANLSGTFISCRSDSSLIHCNSTCKYMYIKSLPPPFNLPGKFDNECASRRGQNHFYCRNATTNLGTFWGRRRQCGVPSLLFNFLLCVTI